MKRTIEIRNEHAYYGGKYVDYMPAKISKYFKLKNSRIYKYVITIVEGSQFYFKKESHCHCLCIHEENGFYVGFVCIKLFSKLFFLPDKNKKYDIIVKKVRKKKK